MARSIPTIVFVSGQIVSEKYFPAMTKSFPTMVRSFPTIFSDNDQIVSDNRFRHGKIVSDDRFRQWPNIFRETLSGNGQTVSNARFR